MVRTSDIPPTNIGTTNTLVVNPVPGQILQLVIIQNRSTGTQTITVAPDRTTAVSGTGIVLSPATDGSGNGEKYVATRDGTGGYIIPDGGIAIIGSAANATYNAHIEVQ